SSDLLYTVNTVVPGSDIRTLTVGTTPNRLFVVQFIDADFCCSDSGNDVNFEVVLHETTNRIDCLYGAGTGPLNNVIGGSATAGLNNSGGTVGYQASLNAANLGQSA